ncbi:hypothetical protein GAMM_40245 [Gammaproteobacteria bacterium]
MTILQEFMRTNKKICQTIRIFFSIAILAYAQFGYANSVDVHTLILKPDLTTYEVNGELAFKEFLEREYIEPYKERQELLLQQQTLKFDQPGIRTLRIVNNWDSDITIKRIFFNADQFSLYPILHSFAIQGFMPDSKIPERAWYEFQIKAEENAGNSIYPGGTQFFVVYRVDDVEGDQLAEFRVKIDYNNDIEFDIRNLLFDYSQTSEDFEACLKQRGYYPIGDPEYDSRCHRTGIFSYDCSNEQTKFCADKPSTKKLIITNKNKDSSAIKITNIDLVPNKTGVHIGDYSSCSNLEAGKTCGVDITIDHDTTDEAVPVYVTYDVNGKKEVRATAAIIIKRNSNDNLKDNFGKPLANSFTKELDKDVLMVIKRFIHDKEGVVKEWLYFPIPLITKNIHSATNEQLIGKSPANDLTSYLNSIGKSIAKAVFEMGIRRTIPASKPYISDHDIPYYFKYMGVEIAAGGVTLTWVDFFIGSQGEYLPESWENNYSFIMKKTLVYGLATVVKMGGLWYIGTCKSLLNGIVGVLSEAFAGSVDDYKNYYVHKESLGNKAAKNVKADGMTGSAEYIECSESQCKCGYQEEGSQAS